MRDKRVPYTSTNDGKRGRKARRATIDRKQERSIVAAQKGRAS